MARFKKGDRVRLSGEVPGVGKNVDGQLGTVASVDDAGVEVVPDGDRSWRFNHPQVEPTDKVEPLDDSASPIGILGKAAQEILEHHVSVEDRDFDTVPQCYMTVGDLRSLVCKAKEEGAL